MFSQSKKCLLALEAVLYIACNANATPVSSKALSKQLGFPVRYLEQLMQKLVRDNILRGIRGPRGGYVLAKDRRHITIGHICQSLEQCSEDDSDNESAFGSVLGKMILQPKIARIEEVILAEMHTHTLEQLCQECKSKEIDNFSTKDNNNYTI